MKIDPEWAEDFLETMYDQLAQHKGEWLADIQMARAVCSLESP
jgi:hypothetical protein